MLEPRGHDVAHVRRAAGRARSSRGRSRRAVHAQRGFGNQCGHATIVRGALGVEERRGEKRAQRRPTRRRSWPAMPVRAGDGPGRGRRHGAVRACQPSPTQSIASRPAAPGARWRSIRVGSRRRLLRLPCRRSDRSRSSLVADACHRRCRAEEITRAAAEAIPIEHPDAPDLAFLYGTILTDGGDGANGTPSRNVCIFAGRQIDRSPTGSGVTARLALMAARRQARAGEERLFESCTDAVFSGKIVREAPPVGRRKSVIVEVGGQAHQTGEARFRLDDGDPLREGFSLGL